MIELCFQNIFIARDVVVHMNILLFNKHWFILSKYCLKLNYTIKVDLVRTKLECVVVFVFMRFSVVEITRVYLTRRGVMVAVNKSIKHVIRYPMMMIWNICKRCVTHLTYWLFFYWKLNADCIMDKIVSLKKTLPTYTSLHS